MTEAIQETEFNKGWESIDATGSTVITPEPSTVEKPAEPVEEVEDVAEKPDEKDTQKAEVSEQKEDENSETYKQRWKSQEGIVKSEKTKRDAAEKRAAELEAEIEKLKTELPEPVSDEVDKLEEKYLEAIIEDDRVAAVKIRKQIDDMKFKQFVENAKKATQEEVASTITQHTNMSKVEKIIEKSIIKYPFLDHTDDKKANPYAIRLVRATRDDYISQGMGFIEALETAVSEIAPMFEVKTKPDSKKSVIDESKVSATVAVETKNNPVRVGGKPKGLQTFDEGWDSYKG